MPGSRHDLRYPSSAQQAVRCCCFQYASCIYMQTCARCASGPPYLRKVTHSMRDHQYTVPEQRCASAVPPCIFDKHLEQWTARSLLPTARDRRRRGPWLAQDASQPGTPVRTGNKLENGTGRARRPSSSALKNPPAAGCVTPSRLHAPANQAATRRGMQRCLGNLGSQAWVHHLHHLIVEIPHCDCEIIAV